MRASCNLVPDLYNAITASAGTWHTTPGNTITSAESLLSAVDEHVNSSPNSPVNNVRSLTNIGHASANSRRLMPYIQAVIEMGYSDELVLQVLLNQMRQGNTITSAESLLSAVDEHVNPSPNSPVHSARSLTNIVAATKLEDPIGGLEDRIMCKICMAKEVEVTFLPCGHLVCCEECSRHVTNCPICRKSVKGIIHFLCAEEQLKDLSLQFANCGLVTAGF
ncbi:baculoviral IAP repeat-containing protein 7-like [Gigantopelta aegis]|uniref:baculoviral IAP repeat-containing protein 7-like n=1 Tax=Gigantopelta aegis TaxID=1735272 RepID=UPI001B88C6D2|nr:baculoviral IAP repeat-containing protein 7-like [Gigantopelta aegis]